jgi:hypothetical protein
MNARKIRMTELFAVELVGEPSEFGAGSLQASFQRQALHPGTRDFSAA